MPTTYAELKAMLDIDEPDYAALAELAQNVVKHLRKMAASSDESLASKAVSLAGFIGDEACIGIVGDATKSRHAVVRVAAAHAAGLLPHSPQTARVVSKMLDDKDVGVVKFAVRAAARQSDVAVTAKAKRAAARVGTMARAAAKDTDRRERAMTMASKASKKSAAMPAGSKKKASPKAAGGMPAGPMSEPAKGAKPADMPAGAMK